MSPSCSRGDEQFTFLLSQAKSGSNDVLGSLLESCRAYLMEVAQRLVPRDLQSKQSADDLVQNALIEALEQIRAFNGPSPDALRVWLRTLLVNDFRDFCRSCRKRKKRQCSRETSLDSISPNDLEYLADPRLSKFDEQVIREERSQLVNRLLTKLTPTDREIVRLHWLEDMPFKEVAAQLGISANAAQKCCLRALATLGQLPYSGEACEDDLDDAH